MSRNCGWKQNSLKLLLVVDICLIKYKNGILLLAATEHFRLYSSQENIPVGFVPPSFLVPGEGICPTPSVGRPPVGKPSPSRQTPPPWTEWQTRVKKLPCPKLRLRAVNITDLLSVISGYTGNCTSTGAYRGPADTLCALRCRGCTSASAQNRRKMWRLYVTFGHKEKESRSRYFLFLTCTICKYHQLLCVHTMKSNILIISQDKIELG